MATPEMATQPSFLSPRDRTPYSEPYWEGLRRGRLILQQCEHCSSFTHPPGPVCTTCQSTARGYVESTGAGQVYTYTITHRAMHPEFEPYLPYVVAYVELDEGITIASWLVDVDPSDLQIGMPVQLAVERIDTDTTLHRFRPADPR